MKQTVLIKRAYKTKLDLNNEQRSYFVGCAGVSRFVYNWALADRKAISSLIREFDVAILEQAAKLLGYVNEAQKDNNEP